MNNSNWVNFFKSEQRLLQKEKAAFLRIVNTQHLKRALYFGSC